jgi:NAD(P)-dependent dehydrogenase (short-subunit alcohol dehydrogenase family)
VTEGLRDKVAIITGASTGLGEVMARALCGAGAKVVGIARTESTLKVLAGVINGKSGAKAFLPIVGDVTSRATCEDSVKRTLDRFGAIDILINNAGVGANHARPKNFKGEMLRFWEMDPDLWDQSQAVNMNACFYMARVAVLPMMKKGWGRIINNTTNIHTMMGPGRASYGPGKAGLEASTLIWARELAGTGVTVNVLIPGGPTNTPIHAHSRGISLDRMLQPGIMTAPTLWLCSPASDGVTGMRFSAKDWDSKLPPAEAAKKAGAPAAWDQISTSKAHIPKYYE